MKNIHGGVLLLIKLQSSACNFTKSYTPPWVFFPFFKVVQMAPIREKHLVCIWLLGEAKTFQSYLNVHGH